MAEKSTGENVKLRYEYIINSFAFEYDVYRRIQATLSQDERIESGAPINLKETEISLALKQYRADIYLPKGCEKLRIKGATYIEVKKRLVLGAVSRYRRLYEEIKNHNDNVVNFIIIYQESSINEDYIRKIRENGLQFLKFSELEKRGLKDLGKKHSEGNAEQRALMEKARLTFENGDVVLFLGAGVSMSAGLPSWDNLLKKMLRRGTSVPESDFDFISEQCFESSIITARYIKILYKNEKDNSNASALSDDNLEVAFKEMLVDELYPSDLNIRNDKAGKYQLINCIGELIDSKNVESVVTYNYDDLMEQELERRNIPYTSINGKNRWMKGDLPIFHVHGMLPSNKQDVIDSDIILSEKEYHNAYKEPYNWSTVEQLHALRYKTCFFIGLSMSDPNLRRLLDLASDGTDKEAHHFVFLQNKTESPFHTSKNAEIIQSMMNRFGLNVIWYQEHEDLPGILKKIGSVTPEC